MIGHKNTPAHTVGTGESVATYVLGDDHTAAGSTLGGPRICMTIKASGAIEKIYSVDAGEVFFGTLPKRPLFRNDCLITDLAQNDYFRRQGPARPRARCASAHPKPIVIDNRLRATSASS